MRFGRHVGGAGGDFCMDPATGEVFLALPERREPWFVNSSLDLFTRTIHLASGFERQFTTGDAEECWIAGEDFSDALKQIDPPAADPANYWGDFVCDVKDVHYSDHENPFGDDDF